MKIINSKFVFSDEENAKIKDLKENATNFMKYINDYCELVATFGLIVKFNKIPGNLKLTSYRWVPTFENVLCYCGNIDGNITCADWVEVQGRNSGLSGWDLWSNRDKYNNELIFICGTGSGNGGVRFDGSDYSIPLYQFPKIGGKIDMQLLENKEKLQKEFDAELNEINTRFNTLISTTFNDLWDTNTELLDLLNTKTELNKQLSIVSKMIEYKRVNIQKIANKMVADSYNINIDDANIDIINTNSLFTLNSTIKQYKEYNLDELFADDEQSNLLKVEKDNIQNIKLKSIEATHTFMNTHPYLLL